MADGAHTLRHPRISGTAMLAGLLLLSAQAAAQGLAECAGIGTDAERLACYDRLAARQAAAPLTIPAPAAPVDQHVTPPLAVAAPEVPLRPVAPPGSLAAHWELGAENKRGTFHFSPHLPNYLIAAYSTAPNSAPYRPFQPLLPDARLSNAELQFQIGFKMKLLENPYGSPFDLWFGYTQQSFWQAGNHAASSPFRETNYQPELMAVLPVDFPVLGLRARFVNFGLMHQSNGQASTLSRSWNRVYAQLGMERGDFTLLARIWHRLPEAADDDDNPRIVDYMGHGDLSATWRWRGHEFSSLGRYNFASHKGGLQLGWAFPLGERLKGYIQYFGGYGQSLIDYDYAQHTLGVGVLINY